MNIDELIKAAEAVSHKVPPNMSTKEFTEWMKSKKTKSTNTLENNMKARTRPNANNGASFRSNHKHGRKSDQWAVVQEANDKVVGVKPTVVLDREEALIMQAKLTEMGKELFVDVFGIGEFDAVVAAIRIIKKTK